MAVQDLNDLERGFWDAYRKFAIFDPSDLDRGLTLSELVESVDSILKGAAMIPHLRQDGLWFLDRLATDPLLIPLFEDTSADLYRSASLLVSAWPDIVQERQEAAQLIRVGEYGQTATQTAKLEARLREAGLPVLAFATSNMRIDSLIRIGAYQDALRELNDDETFVRKVIAAPFRMKAPELPDRPPDVVNVELQLEMLGVVGRCSIQLLSNRSLLRADALMRMGDPHRAFEALKAHVDDLTKPETFRKYSLPEEAMMLPAVILRNINQPESALRLVDAFAEAAPERAGRSLIYLSTKAGILSQLGRNEEAIEPYTLALQLLGDGPPGNRFVLHIALAQVYFHLDRTTDAWHELTKAEQFAKHARPLQVTGLHMLKAQLLDRDGDPAALEAAAESLRVSERYRMSALSGVPFERLPDWLQKASKLPLDLGVKYQAAEKLIEILEMRRAQQLAATAPDSEEQDLSLEAQTAIRASKKKLAVLKDIRAASLEAGSEEMPLRPFFRLLELDQELAGELTISHGKVNLTKLLEKIHAQEQVPASIAARNRITPEGEGTPGPDFRSVREALRILAGSLLHNQEPSFTPGLVMGYLLVAHGAAYLLTIGETQDQINLIRLSDAPEDAEGIAQEVTESLGDALARKLPEDRFAALAIDHSVPASWAQLIAQSEELARRPHVSLVPSGSFLVKASRVEAEETRAYLSIVDPTEDLPYSGQEGLTLAAMTRARVLRGAKCSRAAISSIFNSDSRFDILHFACHAVYDPEDEPRSYLQLHPEATSLGGYYRDIGRLSTADISEWEGAALLVVLAACESATSARDMFGPDSFPAAFLRKGSRSVVASLWPVDDKASLLFAWLLFVGLCTGYSILYAVHRAKLVLASLTISDARGYLRELIERDPINGKRLVTELEQAKIGDGSMQPFAKPHFWAPFVVLGDPTFRLPKLQEETAKGQATDSMA